MPFARAGPDDATAAGLVVFDVDGTLTDTAEIDSRCFADAIREEFGFRDFDSSWASYAEFTDSSIIREIFVELRGEGPTPDEISRLIEQFVGLLERAHAEEPARFAPIPGAPGIVRGLAADRDWRVAVATGGWERSARLKLGYAGIDIGDAPLASAEVSASRTEIVRWAIDEARRGPSGAALGHIVLVGDTRWDLKVARGLGLPFVGVGRGDAKRALAAQGAGIVLEDFVDFDATVRLLANAGPPSSVARGGRL